MIVTQQKPQILYQLGASNGQGNDHVDTVGAQTSSSIQVEPLLADSGPSLSRSSSSRINGGRLRSFFLTMLVVASDDTQT
jgi:hypothetical protein